MSSSTVHDVQPRHGRGLRGPTAELAGVTVGAGQPVFVIAEIGCNFKTYEEGRLLIDAAAAAGADAVKIQTFEPETVASARARFDMRNTGSVLQREVFREFTIDDETHERLFDYARAHGVPFFSTPGHFRDLERLEGFGNPVYKIGSDDAWNLPLLEATAALGKPVVLSTGMCTLGEVRESVATLRRSGCEDLVLLHCLSDYPADPEDVNLLAIRTLARTFPTLPVGYSDHTLGPLVTLGAVALGACVVEKHVTLDKGADGPDHALSADPQELAEMVSAIRTLESALGDGFKRPTRAEIKNSRNNRKSVVAISTIREGALVSRGDVDIKRPGDGIEPGCLDLVVGRRARVDIEAEASLTWEMLE